MPNRIRTTALATALTATTGALAQPQSAVPEARIPGVVVTDTRVPQPSFDLPAAIDSVDARVIGEDRIQVNLSEALGRVPGLVVRNRGNYAQDLQVTSRGFGGRATFGVRGVRLVADGIPATMPDGQGQAAAFDLATAERIEVLRGPFASLYGNASGGIVQVFTADGPSKPTLTGSLYSGSDRTSKAALRFGGQQGDLNYLAGASRFRTDGYRRHSAALRDQFNAKLMAPIAQGRLTLVANGLHQPGTQDPLGLTRAQFEGDPRQVDPAAIAFDTRKSIRQGQLGAVHEVVLTREDTLVARLHGGARTVLQFLPQSGDTPLGSGGVVDLDRRYGGIGLRWTRTLAGGERPLVLSVGVERDRLDERRRGFVNEAGTKGPQRRDEDDAVANTDAFAQAEWRFAPRWSASAGARHSRVAFRSRDYFVTEANPDDSGVVEHSRTTPVAGLVFRATPRWNLYANAGEGFETPTFAELAYRPGGATGLNFDLRPAHSRHGEIGAKGRLGDDGRFTAAMFRIATRDEIVTDASAGGRTTYRNASRTMRRGVELAAQGRLGHGFEAAAAWTWLDARFTEAFVSGTPPAAVPPGAKLPGVARSVLYAELAWRHAASGFHAAVELRASSRVFVNEANTDAAGGYSTTSLRAGFERRLRDWEVRSFLRIDNAGDRRHAGSVIVAETRGRYFEPAPGRTVLVGVSTSRAF